MLRAFKKMLLSLYLTTLDKRYWNFWIFQMFWMFPFEYSTEASLILQSCFKKADIQFKRNNVIRLRILNFKTIPPYSWTYGEVTPLLIKVITSLVLLFPLYIWKQTVWINCSDQLINEILFEHLHEENTKPSINLSVLHAWIFLST